MFYKIKCCFIHGIVKTKISYSVLLNKHHNINTMTKTKNSLIYLRISEDDKQTLKEYSKKARLTMSAYIRLMTIGKN
jgi:hypothetical protein